MKKAYISCVAAAWLLAAPVALAAEGGMDGQQRGTAHEGYGHDNPRGKAGGAAYGPNPVYDGTRACNRCSDLTVVGKSTTTTTRSYDLNVGMTGPLPSGSFTVKGPTTSRTTTYGKPDRGIDADGRSCPCR